ncbi:NACHT domain-containing protein [Streptomyces sp. NPDC093111]|uniref:NACHT domain-containing protein n=1 Tax=Streptomyces sp. NPDC093111 TaxID=3154978 RepID=UPI00341C845D
MGRGLLRAGVGLSLLVGFAGLAWTGVVLGRGGLDAGDTAGVLSFGAGLVSMFLGGASFWAALAALRGQRDPESVARRLALQVAVEAERRYAALLGGDLGGLVDLEWTARLSGAIGSTEPLTGRLTGLATFQRGLLPGRLVVTGRTATGRPTDAGTGKTLTATTLLLALSRDRSPGDPVPVPLSAADWPDTPLRDWVRDQLVRAWALPPAEAELLLRAHLVLPVIDGVDEADSAGVPGPGSRSARLVEAVNDFQGAGTRAAVVSTCRADAYAALDRAGAAARTVAVVELQPVRASSAREYLKNRVADTTPDLARWQPVLDALQPPAGSGAPPQAPPLRAALNTPWLLTLAATVYARPRGGVAPDPRQLLLHAGAGTLREHLLNRYPAALVATAPAGSRTARLDPAAAWRRLHVLAAYLDDGTVNPDDDLNLTGWRLWPIGGATRVRRIELALVAVLTAALVLVPTVLLGSGVLPLAAVAWVVLIGPGVLVRRQPSAPAATGLGLLRTSAGRRSAALRLAAAIALTCASWAVVGLVPAVALGAGLGLALLLDSALAEPPTAPRRLLRDDLGWWLTLWALTAGAFALHLRPGFDPGTVLGASAALCLGMQLALLGDFWIGRIREGAEFLRNLAVGPAAAPALTTTLAVGVPVAAVQGIGTAAVTAVVLFPLLAVLGRWTPVTEWLAAGVAYLLSGVLVFCLSLTSGWAGGAWLRYTAMRIAMARRLPYRLTTFLTTCEEAGLLRPAGLSHQFRHRQLQDHLARFPDPPSVP